MRGTKSYRAGGLPAPSLAIHGPFDERDFARVMRPHRIPVRLVKPDIALKKQATTLNLRLRSGRGLVARHECPDWVCAVKRRRVSSGCESHPATAPAGSNRSSHGGDEMAEAFG